MAPAHCHRKLVHPDGLPARGAGPQRGRARGVAVATARPLLSDRVVRAGRRVPLSTEAAGGRVSEAFESGTLKAPEPCRAAPPTLDAESRLPGGGWTRLAGGGAVPIPPVEVLGAATAGTAPAALPAVVAPSGAAEPAAPVRDPAA